MRQNNADIREYAKSKSVMLWQIADVLGCSEPTMTRKMRYELSDDEKKKMRSVIDGIVSRRA